MDDAGRKIDRIPKREQLVLAEKLAEFQKKKEKYRVYQQKNWQNSKKSIDSPGRKTGRTLKRVWTLLAEKSAEFEKEYRLR